MREIQRQVIAKKTLTMANKAMAKKLLVGSAIDVGLAGLQVERGLFELPEGVFVDGKDYCVADSESWVWSIGRRKSDARVFAATDTRFYCNAEYECLWLR